MFEDGSVMASMLHLRDLGDSLVFSLPVNMQIRVGALSPSEGVSRLLGCLQHMEEVLKWWLRSCSHGTYRPKIAGT